MLNVSSLHLFQINCERGGNPERFFILKANINFPLKFLRNCFPPLNLHLRSKLMSKLVQKNIFQCTEITVKNPQSFLLSIILVINLKVYNTAFYTLKYFCRSSHFSLFLWNKCRSVYVLRLKALYIGMKALNLFIFYFFIYEF